MKAEKAEKWEACYRKGRKMIGATLYMPLGSTILDVIKAIEGEEPKAVVTGVAFDCICDYIGR